MLTVRSFPRPAVSSCQGKLFIIGGNRRSNGHAAERYDPVVNSWIPLRSFQRRIRYCAVATVQGLLYVIGGVDEDDNRLSSVQRYDPDINLWQEMPSLSSPRSIVCAVGDGSRLYAIGGCNFDGKFVKTAETFDAKENAWSGEGSHQLWKKEGVPEVLLSIRKGLCLEALEIMPLSQIPVKCMIQLTTYGVSSQVWLFQEEEPVLQVLRRKYLCVVTLNKITRNCWFMILLQTRKYLASLYLHS